MTDDLITRLLNTRHYVYADCEEAAEELAAKDKRIDELEKALKLAVWTDSFECQELEKDNVKLRARIAELEAALKPFADCGVWDGYKDEEVFKLGFKIADLRAARAALEKK